ncbi:hypothetical protein QTQ03_18185 [Micromonospora sp. WMMA1363]|uniref:hypothetical protein n=1 Tax=Micromonospora sp. WMMA1363 TaxID=3053985 RepID=UPI00259CC922|nr:hypothetical protein [Micromonospora sp. WMMA1363]MDM4721435.1 hypothetical protein [Micromonospora sp. WMMA1363]
MALAECGTHAFVAAEIGGYAVGEKTLAQRLYPRLRSDELLTADRGFYSWQAWDAAQATGAALLWRTPNQLDLPVVKVLSDGTYLTVLIKPTVHGGRRERLLAAARGEADLTDINTVPDAFDDQGLPAGLLHCRVAAGHGRFSGSHGVDELVWAVTGPASCFGDVGGAVGVVVSDCGVTEGGEHGRTVVGPGLVGVFT